MDSITGIFEEHRSRLFNIAYGMLGRVAPAEDAVQETYLRWQKLDLGQIQSPGAYLSTIVSRICLDELKSARNQKRQYVGPDLPEPLVESSDINPRQYTEMADSLSMAFMMILQKLTPLQRAVFMLHEVFEYKYSHIAEMVDKSESHCRKIAQRARNHIRRDRSRFDVDRKQKDRLFQSFMEAVQEGNVTRLEQMLAKEAILYSDGGGKVSAARKPIYGPNNIARFMVGIRKNYDAEDVDMEFTTVNGEPGMIAYINGEFHSVWSFDIQNQEIQHIFAVLNPDKLNHLKNRKQT